METSWLKSVITSVKDSSLFGVVKLAWDRNLETHSDTALAGKWKRNSDGNWQPTRLSITLSALRTVVVTGLQISVSVACLATQLTVAAWGIARPKVFARKSNYY